MHYQQQSIKSALLVSICVTLAPVSALSQRMPEPDPPLVIGPEEVAGEQRQDVTSTKLFPTIEWTMHRSLDGTIPSDAEQEMMWLMNRARQNPTAEGIFLAETDDSQVQSAINFFGVDLDLLKSDFASLEPMPPAAFDMRLYDASRVHALDLIARDAQDHTGQIEAVQDAGFAYSFCRMSVYSYAYTAFYAHAGLNIDWGYGPGGMQDPPGHRYAIMGVGPDTISNVGLAVVPEDDPNTDVGPLVFAGAYCHGQSSEQNRYLVGTVWEDLDKDGEYDLGEGLGDVAVMPDQGDYYAITANSGGFAVPITGTGRYVVHFSGGELGNVVSRKVFEFGTDSVLGDLKAGGNGNRQVMLRRQTDFRWLGYLLDDVGDISKAFLAFSKNAAYEWLDSADFDGDGEYDVLLRDIAGTLNGRWLMYRMNGLNIKEKGFVGITGGTRWNYLTHGDFNGDGRADVLLQDTLTGVLRSVMLDGHSVGADFEFGSAEDLSGVVVSAEDIDGDAIDDVLLRRTDGSWVLYRMDGSTPPPEELLAITTNLDFQVKAVADYDADGDLDLLMRHIDGRWRMYLFETGQPVVNAFLPLKRNLEYSFMSSGDFNGDGAADVLLRRADALWYLYEMNGFDLLSAGVVKLSRNPTFELVGDEDLNSDGISDLLLRRSDGRWLLYFMGPEIQKITPGITSNSEWAVQR